MTRHLSPDELRAIAIELDAAATALEHAVSAAHVLDPAVIADLLAANRALATARAQIVTNQIGVSVNGLKLSVAQLAGVTRKAAAALKIMDDLGAVVGVIADVAALAAGVARGDVKAIGDAAKALAKRIGTSLADLA